MIRLQIQVTEEQFNLLKQLSAERGISIAKLVREGIDIIIKKPVDKEEARKLALAIIGKYRSGTSNISVEHDKYLDEIYSS